MLVLGRRLLEQRAPLGDLQMEPAVQGDLARFRILLRVLGEVGEHEVLEDSVRVQALEVGGYVADLIRAHVLAEPGNRTGRQGNNRWISLQSAHLAICRM
jgi:hypothetical protein